MYKIQSLQIDENTLTADARENIDLIKTLSDNFQARDETAAELDDLVYKQLIELGFKDVSEQVDVTPKIIEPEAMGFLSSDKFFYNSNYFKNYPEKILGEKKIDKDRWGKEIEMIVGDITCLENIDANYDIVPKESSVALSDIHTIDTDSEFKDSEKITENSEKDIIQKTLRRAKKKKSIASEDLKSPINSYDLNMFEDVFASSLNENISDEELKVFLWHKQKIGQPLSSNWYELADTSMAMLNTGNAVPKKWIEEGLVFYINDDLLPAYLYLAENVFDKMNLLIKGDGSKGVDADYIINNYGKSVYDKQVSMLKQVYDEKYKNRLIIKGEGADDGLVLQPTSKISKEFMIDSLVDEVPFKIKKVTAQSNKNYGKPDFINAKNSTRYGDEKDFEKLSLLDAFQYWLVKYGNEITYKKSNYQDIIKYYINQSPRPKTPEGMDAKTWASIFERTKAKAKEEGDRLYGIFLDKYLKLNDKVKLEFIWNNNFNSYVPIDYKKVPVAFNVSKTLRGTNFDIKPEKREAISFVFTEGSGCLAYDVGVGKTICAILIIEQFICAGYCKRPFIVVPNQTYRQWLSEIRGVLPHRKINDMYNLRGEYYEQQTDEDGKVMKVDEDSISVMTYEGFETMSFNENTEARIFSELYDILNQGGQEESEKQKESFRQRLLDIIGRGLKGGMINVEDLGLDFICYDEAHALKKVFTMVKGEHDEDTGKREKTQYKIQAGQPSTTALKGFMISQYVLNQNHGRNVLLLTATPFTNSPLEIFSMLALIAYKKLKETDLNNITDFFDNYIKTTTELVINAKMKPQYRQIIKGFNNLPALQTLIKRFFNYKTGEDVGVERPSKIIIPLQKKVVDGNVFKLQEGERIDSYIEMTPFQQSLMDKVKSYAEGAIGEDQISMNYGSASVIDDNGEEVEMVDVDSIELDEGSLDKDEKAGVRILKSMSYARNLALSPHLFVYSGLGNPKDYKDYIENSPKLKYVMDCVKSVKKYHNDKGEPVSGQIIYMDRGIQYFHLIKQYLVKEVGYKEHEIGEIYSQMKGGKDAKSNIQNAFLGLKYNTKIKDFEQLSDDERIKVVIGSSTIKEGMNLQRKTTVLYNCFIDWNPTDFIQLCGRCWRQGNEFANVRIVIPLMIDSADIFMFQKLEEKTERINTLWSNDGRSVLKLEDVDPSEIKNALIKDPNVLALIKIEEQQVRIQDEINAEKSTIKRIENIKEYVNTIKRHHPSLISQIEEIRPSKASKNINGLIREFQDILKTQIDEEGKEMVFEWRRKQMTLAERQEKNISEKDPVSKPYWFDGLNTAIRNLDRERRDFLVPKKINESDLDNELLEVQHRIDALAEQDKLIKDKDNIQNIVSEIIEERKRNKVTIKPLTTLVNEFASLNNLLSVFKKDREIKKENADLFCSLVDESGERRIDDEAIEHLENCIAKLPQTKALHTDENGEYTEERKDLHGKIISELDESKTCIKTEAPIAVLTGGSPGSGKSTFLKKYAGYLTSDQIYKIDADAIRAKLPEYIKTGGWNATATQDETKDIINFLLSENNLGSPCSYDLVYDGTMNKTKNYKPLIKKLRDLGYKIFIVYMDNVPYAEVLRRVKSRYKKTGRYVPKDVVDDFFGKGKDALNELKNKVDGYVVIDAMSKDYNVIEKGGIDLPTDRGYSKLTTSKGLREYEQKEKITLTKSVISKKIKGFELLLKMSKDEVKKAVIEKKIRGFKLLMKTVKFKDGGNV